MSAVVLASSFARPAPVFSETGVAETGRGVEIQPELAEGLPIGLITIHLEKSTGDPSGDEALKEQVSAAFALGEGTTFRRVVVEFSVKPTETLEFILDYFRHRADELNNLGGVGPLQTLGSKDLGQEVTFTAFHYIGKHLFFQGIASVGIPGEVIDRALGGHAENWYTLQAALYMFF